MTLLSHHPHPTHGSLGNNQLCGLNYRGEGTYTAEGITKLCEGLKGSAVTSLKCAAAPRVFAFVSAPADTFAFSPSPLHLSFTGSLATTSEPRAHPRSPPSSRRRRSPTWSAPPPPECLLLCQRPLTRLTTRLCTPPAVLGPTNSVPKEEPRLPRASRATRSCSRSSRLLGHSNRLPSVCFYVSAR